MAGIDTSETTASAFAGSDNTPRWHGHLANRVVLFGELITDPVLIRTKGGHAMARVRIVTHDEFGAEFHRITAWRELGESLNELAKKGRTVRVWGRIHGTSWIGKDGLKRYGMEIIADAIQLTDR
jgi:single stranded DNA-binding protein